MYLVFTGSHYYPDCGGENDFVGTYPHHSIGLEAAIAAAKVAHAGVMESRGEGWAVVMQLPMPDEKAKYRHVWKVSV